ncbi:MAG: aminomethyl-transferring glycine dehydrogenase, partial [Hungatella sp.]
MGSYVSTTKSQQEEMLKEIGYNDYEALFAHIPKQVLYRELDIPEGCSELEVSRKLEKMAAKNKVFPHIFRGAGAYHHYIPAIVAGVTGKEDFVTAYTPYQAEISQGNLQAIFEFQTMLCELTGMDA